jgi:hypothetical protein
MKHLILLMIVMIFVSCESNETTNNDSVLGDENCILTTDLWESGGGGREGCQYQHHDDFMKRYVEGSGDEDGTSFVIDEIVVLEDRNEIAPIGECGKENKCGITFKNYDRSLFKDSLIGKEVTVYYKESYFGGLVVVKHKDGTIIAVKGVNIFCESNDQGKTDGLWPSSLVPQITIKQEVLSTCEPFCIKYQRGEDHEPLGDWVVDSLVAPPLKITVEGKDPVIVSNGEVVTSEGYEYFVRNSVRATEDDEDGKYSNPGVEYTFDFFIVNTEALK